MHQHVSVQRVCSSAVLHTDTGPECCVHDCSSHWGCVLYHTETSGETIEAVSLSSVAILMLVDLSNMGRPMLVNLNGVGTHAGEPLYWEDSHSWTSAQWEDSCWWISIVGHSCWSTSTMRVFFFFNVLFPIQNEIILHKAFLWSFKSLSITQTGLPFCVTHHLWYPSTALNWGWPVCICGSTPCSSTDEDALYRT